MPLIGSGIVEVELDKITSGTSQARQRNVGVSKDDDLVSSIRKNGLLSPIILKRLSDGGFEIVVGQRRFLAHKELGMSTIKACILEGDVSEIDAKKISLIENLARKDMKHADYVDTVQWFMDRYNSTTTVAEELGISAATVRKYLTISRLPSDVKGDIEQKTYETRDALRALEALGNDETTVDVEMLRETAKEMHKLAPQVQKKLISVKKHEPGTPIGIAIEKAKKRAELHKFTIEVTPDQQARIGMFQSSRRLDSFQYAAAELIDMGLEAAEE